MLARRRLTVAKGGVLGWVHQRTPPRPRWPPLSPAVPARPTTSLTTCRRPGRRSSPPWPPRSGPHRRPGCRAGCSGLAAPDVASFVVGTSMRVGNDKARTELDWRPAFPTYRAGIDAMVSTPAESERSSHADEGPATADGDPGARTAFRPSSSPWRCSGSSPGSCWPRSTPAASPTRSCSCSTPPALERAAIPVHLRVPGAQGRLLPGPLHRHRPPRPERLLLYLLVRESKEAATPSPATAR